MKKYVSWCVGVVSLHVALSSVTPAWADDAPPAVSGNHLVATSAWQAAEAPVFCDPDDDWAKDPSVIKAGDRELRAV